MFHPSFLEDLQSSHAPVFETFRVPQAPDVRTCGARTPFREGHHFLRCSHRPGDRGHTAGRGRRQPAASGGTGSEKTFGLRDADV